METLENKISELEYQIKLRSEQKVVSFTRGKIKFKKIRNGALIQEKAFQRETEREMGVAR